MGRKAGTPEIYLRGNVYWCRFTVGGKQERKPTGTGDPVKAAEAAQKLHAEAVLAIRPVVAPRAVAALPEGDLVKQAAKYLAWAASQGRDKGYLDAQEIHFRAHFIPRWRTVHYITSAAIARYQIERREGGKKFPDREPEQAVGTVTLYKEMVTLSRFLTWAKRERLIDAIPDFERPTQTTDYEVPNLSPEDVLRFLKALPTRLQHPRRCPIQEQAIFTWAMALRKTEARSIRWPDVDLPGGTLKVRAEIDKAGKDWILPLTKEARAILAAEALRPHKPDGVIFSLKDVRATFEQTCERLNLPYVTPHHLRHFRITEWANNTRRLASVQFMARHLSIATTAKYVRSTTEAAAQMLDEIDANNSSTATPKISSTGPLAAV